MDAKEKAVARTLLQNKVYKSDGQTYEDLFVKSMGHYNSNFVPVKPQGRIGDRKNDGFDRTTGTYYQVFAPENIEIKQKEAIEKLVDDFSGLKKHWNDKVAISEFRFVVNDKYKGAFPTLLSELDKIKKDHNLSDAAPFLAKDLEDLIFSLPDDKIFDVVGHVPSVEKIENIKFSELGDVLEYLFKNIQVINKQSVLDAPDFQEKIKFNYLGPQTSSMLQTGSLQAGSVEEYFELNSEFEKEKLREVFATLYSNALEKFDTKSSGNFADNVFFEILQNAFPSANGHHQNCIIVLMAYFFEACDIYEKPENLS